MSPREEIIKVLSNVTGEKIVLDRPKNEDFGDYTTNIALVLGKKEGKSPNEIAQDLVNRLKKENLKGIGEVEVVGGFVNFRLSDEFLQSQVQEIIKKGDSFGSSDDFKGKKARVEFISANPTGPLHIGNARGGPIGDVLSNVLEKRGYEVTREYLHNDVGGQVNKLGQSIYYTLNPDQKPEEELAYRGEYIKELAAKVKSSKLKVQSAEEMGKVAVQILFEQIMEDTKAMGIEFDEVWKESDLRLKVPAVLDRLEKVLKEKDGALWFAPSDEFLKDRETVVRKSDKEYTYFASDIAYHDEKMKNSDLVVDVLGGNHSGHVPRIQAAVKALGYDVSKFKVILYQHVRIKEGKQTIKMSKREGTFVTAKEVLDEVGKDAFRFFLLMSGPDTHMDFDLELAKKKAQDNPVFYVQYAYSRIHGIFLKESDFDGFDTSLLKEKEEMELVRHLVKFPELLQEISENFSVHSLTSYALQTANLFHRLYEAHRVLSDDKEKTKVRLALLFATKTVLKNTLTLLGVEAPERM